MRKEERKKNCFSIDNRFGFGFLRNIQVFYSTFHGYVVAIINLGALKKQLKKKKMWSEKKKEKKSEFNCGRPKSVGCTFAARNVVGLKIVEGAANKGN